MRGGDKSTSVESDGSCRWCLEVPGLDEYVGPPGQDWGLLKTIPGLLESYNHLRGRPWELAHSWRRGKFYKGSWDRQFQASQQAGGPVSRELKTY